VANEQIKQHVIPFGTSEPQDFELRDEGVAFDGTSFTLALDIKKLVDGTPTTVPSPPSVAWLTAATGKVRVTGVETLDVGNYLVRYKVTDGGGNAGFFPNGDKAELWRIVAIPAR
jgi:hypothetical protein